MLHLLARKREMRPLFLGPERPMKVLWYNRPYLGVAPLVLRARNRAFSAPRIWRVEAGYLARLVREPACEIKRAATGVPRMTCKLGATWPSFLSKDSAKIFL